jgi:hypothetical protein
MVRLNCGLGDVIAVQEDLMIPTAQIELGEETRPFELVQEFVNDGN